LLPRDGQVRILRRMIPATRSFRRAAVIVALVLLALGLDAAAGFNITMMAGCVAFFVVQLLAMTAGSVLAVIGLVIWIFSRFRSPQALGLVVGALALAAASLLINHFAGTIGFVCGD
jgi:hypothetical protein